MNTIQSLLSLMISYLVTNRGSEPRQKNLDL